MMVPQTDCIHIVHLEVCHFDGRTSVVLLLSLMRLQTNSGISWTFCLLEAEEVSLHFSVSYQLLW